MKMNREHLIKKWLADELTDAEDQAFQDLDDYNTHLRILEGAQAFKANEVSNLVDFDVVLENIRNSKTTKVRNIREYYVPFLKIAASIMIIVGMFSMFFLPINASVTTGIGQQKVLELPDDSEVQLNAKSNIFYSKRQWKEKRLVNLDGEAFFRVSKGSKFDVVTQSGKISVLGTQFNVKSREDYFEVMCVEGLVAVQIMGKPAINLKAGNSVKIINGNVYLEENLLHGPSWMDNQSTFRSVPFGDVLMEFKRQYPVTFDTHNIDVNRIFTGGFVHNSLPDALKSITLPLDLNYRIDQSSHITFQKRKE